MNQLDQQVDHSLHEIQRRRKVKLALVIAGLVVAVGVLLAMTGLMYSADSSPETGADKIGAESFM